MFFSAPPAGPRRRRPWLAPVLGDHYKRASDGIRFWVSAVYTRDRQVRLEPDGDGDSIYVWASDLDALYRRDM